MSHPILRLAATRCAPALAALVRLWSRTWRIELRGAARLAAARNLGPGVLYCFHHGRMLELAAAHAGRGIAVLVSSHPDGVLAARVVARLGYVPIYGSPRQGALRGARALLLHAARGGDLGLASDVAAASGSPRLARLTGHALVPVAAAARPRRRVGSWDRFELPAPGARVLIEYGAPLQVSRGAGRAAERAWQERLEAEIARLEAALEHELDLSGAQAFSLGRSAERAARGA